ncbi:MAG: metallophosphoesterase [Pelobium sp.]
MSNRRNFIKTGIAGATISLLPSINLFAHDSQTNKRAKKLKLRFALASDGHYGQKDVNSDQQFEDLLKWLNQDHEKNHLDFAIINGDIVHDRPDLLASVDQKFFKRFKFPYYTLPGNHDHADTDLWTKVFGYGYNYIFEKGNIGFVMGNTSNIKGEYLCPDNKFLKDSLELYKDKKTIFVVLHIPPHQWLPEDTFYANCPDTIKILHEYPNVKATFHGHDHNIDGVRYTNKLPHFFDAHFGGNWGTSYMGYRIVEIDKDDHIYTYQVNASMNPTLNENTL